MSSSPPSLQSLKSWDSDHGSEFLTQSEADRKFMKQFKHDKCQYEEEEFNKLSEYKGSAASQGGSYCGSGCAPPCCLLTQQRSEEFPRRASAVVSSEQSSSSMARRRGSGAKSTTARSEEQEGDGVSFAGAVNSCCEDDDGKEEKERVIAGGDQKHFRRSMTVREKPEWKAAEFVRLPEINLQGHEPGKIEAYSVWGQLDSLLPTFPPIVGAKLEQSEQSSEEEAEDDDQSQGDIPAYHKYLRAINDSETESSTSSCDMVDQVVDDLVEGMLEEMYDELVDICNPYFDLNVAVQEATADDSLEASEQPSVESGESSGRTQEALVRLDFRTQLTQQMVAERGRESPSARGDSEIFFCQKHDSYVQMKEVIYNNSASCNFVQSDWPDLAGGPSAASKSREVCKDSLTKELTLKVHVLDIEEFNERCGGTGGLSVDLSRFDSARLPFSIFDNFSKVKSLIAKRSAIRMQIMSGFFLVDGAILDPSKENVQFHRLDVKQQSEIALICQLDTNDSGALLEN